MNSFKPSLKLVIAKIQPYSTLMSNFGYLSILQIFNLLLPLLTYPYLIKVLGTETYGEVIYAQVVISYLVVLVNFGFNITATKEISINRNNILKVSEISSSVFIIKGTLFTISVIALKIFLSFASDSNSNELLFYLTLWMCSYEFLFPLWYFQGIEKMKYITVLTLVSRLFFLALVFGLVKEKSDFLLVPIINGVGTLFSCLVSFLILFKNGIRLKWQPIQTLFRYIRSSYIMALSYATNILKTNFSLIIVKHFFSYTEVVYFDLALKVINIAITFLDLISQAVFPRMSLTKDSRFLKKILVLSTIVSFFMMAFIQIFSDKIVIILGGTEMSEASELTKLLAFNLPVYIVGALLGRNCLLVNGFDKSILHSMLYSALIYAILILFYIKIFPSLTLEYFVYVYLISFLFETIYRYQICVRKKLL